MLNGSAIRARQPYSGARTGVGEAITNTPPQPSPELPSPELPSQALPSFPIAGAAAASAPALRLDRINSQQLFQQARRVMYRYQEGCPSGAEPCGVVLQGARGRVVFEPPVLLPDEQFVPVELLQGRPAARSGSRLRMPRSR